MLKRFLIIPLASLVLGIAGAAQAVTLNTGDNFLVAGTDFSYFLGSFFADCDGDFVEDTSCAANHSDLDPNGLGAESAAFGTISFTAATATTGSLASNINLPVTAGQSLNPFDSFTLQASEIPSVSTNALSLVGTGASVVDFAFNTGGLNANTFRVDFGAQAQTGGAGSNIVISADFGSGFQFIQNVVVSAIDTAFGADVFAGSATAGVVRLEFQSGVAIDNLGISAVVPEPGAMLLLGTGILGLGLFGRRRA